MSKGLDKGATQLRIEGQCREMNPGGAYAGLADDLGLKVEREVCPTCRGSGSDGGRQYPDGEYEAFKCEACDGFGTAQQGCTLCGSNDHSTTGCPMRAKVGAKVHRAMLLRDEPRLQAILPQGAILCGQEPVEVVLADDYAALRQQLAGRDATIERLEAGIPRIQEQSHQRRQQRDKLAGLLIRARGCIDAMGWDELETEIDAALAEVEP